MIATAVVIAHIGAVVSNARFTHPAPRAFENADASFDVAWEDGDLDPTGRFYFYYLDHAPNFQISAESIERIATPIPGPPSDGIYASCDGTRDCRNQFTWDTSAIAEGAYWLIAVNVDPPYFVYNASDGPVRIAHDGGSPPAAIITSPDGIGNYSTTFNIRWLAAGSAPLTFTLTYGFATPEKIFDPPLPLAGPLTLPPATDGSYGYDWDLSALANGVYFLRVAVADGAGFSTFTDSHFGLTVYHPPDSGAGDGGTTMQPQGCGCQLAPTPAPPLLAWLVPLVVFRRSRMKRIISLLVVFSLRGSVAHAEESDATLCIAPLRLERRPIFSSSKKLRKERVVRVTVDDQAAVEITTKVGAEVRLPRSGRHSYFVRFLDGKLYESDKFWFRETPKLCLWYRELHGNWLLDHLADAQRHGKCGHCK